MYKINESIYSTGNYILYLIIIYNEKESGKEHMCVYIHECVCVYVAKSSCCTSETNTVL